MGGGGKGEGGRRGRTPRLFDVAVASTPAFAAPGAVTYVISIKTHAYKWVEGSSFWDSPTLEIPTTKENEEALKLYKEGKNKQRQGI